MDRESIDKEYAELCTKYGDACQKIDHLTEQEGIQLEALDKQRHEIEQAYAKARIELVKQKLQIEARWKELRTALDDLKKADVQAETSDTPG